MARRHHEGQPVNPETDNDSFLGLHSNRRRVDTLPEVSCETGPPTGASSSRQTYFGDDIIMVPQDEPKVSTRTLIGAGNFYLSILVRGSIFSFSVSKNYGHLLDLGF